VVASSSDRDLEVASFWRPEQWPASCGLFYPSTPPNLSMTLLTFKLLASGACLAIAVKAVYEVLKSPRTARKPWEVDKPQKSWLQRLMNRGN
jgi:hypothetical protein